MSSVFSSIGGALGSKTGGGIMAGAGLLSNFLANRQKSKYLSDQINYQKYLRSLSQDPAKMNEYIQGFERPLSQGLLTSVGNQAQAFGAERGLSTSPQLMTEIESQALAPYMMQEQQQGINAAFSSLGLPNSTPNFGSGKGVDITSMIKQLMSPQAAPSAMGTDPGMGDQPAPGISDSPIGPDAAPWDTSGGSSGFDISSLLESLSPAFAM